MQYETRITRLTVAPIGKPIFSEMCTLEPFGDFESATVTGDAVRTFADASARVMYERAHIRN